jgi:hypothetical protein
MGNAWAVLFLATGLFFLVVSLAGPKRGVRHVFPSIALLTIGAAAAIGALLELPKLAPAPGVRPVRQTQPPGRHGAAPPEPSIPPRVLAAERRKRDLVLAALVAAALSPLAFGRSLGRHGELARLCKVTPLADSNLDWGQDLLRLQELLEQRGIRPDLLSIAYFGGDLPSYRIPAAMDLLEGGAPRRYLAISRELQLLGPQAALYPSGTAGVQKALELIAPGKNPIAVGRAGDSIDLYEVGASAGAGTSR